MPPPLFARPPEDTPKDRWTEQLLETGDLAKPQIANRFLILDVRPREQYASGHISRAVWLDYNAWAKTFRDGPDKRLWEGIIGGIGLKHDTHIVIYDEGVTYKAAYIWWILRYWGHEDVRLLDGGWQAWISAGNSITTAEAVVLSRRIKLRPAQFRLATRSDVVQALQSHSDQIIDARSLAEFRGDTKTARRNGAIPTARHLDASAVLDPRQRHFKSAEDLAEAFQGAGIDPNRPVITYCHSGEKAAVVALALEILGARDVRVYHRGWQEWGNAADTPVALAGKMAP